MGYETDFLRISVGHQIGRAFNHFWQECASRLRPHRITPKQFSMLSLICRKPGISQQEICGRSASNPPLVARLLQSLAKRRLIRRQASLEDRRPRREWQRRTSSTQGVRRRAGRLRQVWLLHPGEGRAVFLACEDQRQSTSEFLAAERAALPRERRLVRALGRIRLCTSRKAT